MDYSDILLNDNSEHSKNSWNLEENMENNNDLFGWGNKRKLSMENEENQKRLMMKSANGKVTALKKNLVQRGSLKLEQWQVDDYGDFNDIVVNQYNANDNILALTVWNPDAPTDPKVINQNHQKSNITNDLPIVSSSTYLIEDNRFQYVLAAATSIATKVNDDTLTYLNQGQSYEIKFKKLGDLSLFRGKLLKSYIRLCFHERRFQYVEKEQMLLWQSTRPGDRILEADVPLSYGAYDINQSPNNLNMIHFNWDPTKEVGVYIKVNCISTEFTAKKHGGEKGVPFRIQIETYQNNENGNDMKKLHAAACQIKVFKLKGADRKHKQDREKIIKRSPSEQEKYQPSYDCTVLNDLPNDYPPSLSPLSSHNDSVIESQGQDQISKSENIITRENEAPVSPPMENKILLLQTKNSLQLTEYCTPQELSKWLLENRFEKYLETFEKYSGEDMLRLSQEDIIEICGIAEGIRLYNSLQSKPKAAKLKLYICCENAHYYNALFLSTHSNSELAEKLATLLNISSNQIRDVFMEGPHGIHIQVNDDVVKHFKDETMFTIHTLTHAHDGYVLLLKNNTK